jgi:hypothetical protein
MSFYYRDFNPGQGSCSEFKNYLSWYLDSDYSGRRISNCLQIARTVPSLISR